MTNSYSAFYHPGIGRCYLYRLFDSIFRATKHWATFDPFFQQKEDTFRESGTAVHRKFLHFVEPYLALACWLPTHADITLFDLRPFPY